MARLTELTPAHWSIEQRQVHERIANGPRGRVRGPLLAWLRSPRFAAPAQQIGEYLRFHSRLGPRLTELAILVVARHWGADYIWRVHAPLAIQHGIAAPIVDALAHGRPLSFEQPADALVDRVVRALLRSGRLDDDAYAEARGHFDEAALVDLCGVVGYYTMGAMTLGVFDMVGDAGEPAVLPPLGAQAETGKH
jgi:4-carboxymuconolactone decarboxylase